MLKNINPTKTVAWSELQSLFDDHTDMKISTLFANDPERFKAFSRRFDDHLLVDFSKNLITDEIFTKLLTLAEEVDLKGAIKAQFSGENCVIAAIHRCLLMAKTLCQKLMLYLKK
jgi:glucose-6-phosphate isomerase